MSVFPRQAEAALMYDAVHVLAHALQQVDKSTRLRLVNLTCDGDQAWAYGSSLYNYLNLVSRFEYGRERPYSSPTNATNLFTCLV